MDYRQTSEKLMDVTGTQSEAAARIGTHWPLPDQLQCLADQAREACRQARQQLAQLQLALQPYLAGEDRRFRPTGGATA